MAFDKSDMLGFINALRESDSYIEDLFMCGSCYQFHLFLSKVFDGCEPWINQRKDHIITKFEGSFYDIMGLANERGFTPLSEVDKPMVSEWSFYSINMLRLTDCEHCEAPFVYERPPNTIDLFIEDSDKPHLTITKDV